MRARAETHSLAAALIPRPPLSDALAASAELVSVFHVCTWHTQQQHTHHPHTHLDCLSGLSQMVVGKALRFWGATDTLGGSGGRSCMHRGPARVPMRHVEATTGRVEPPSAMFSKRVRGVIAVNKSAWIVHMRHSFEHLLPVFSRGFQSSFPFSPGPAQKLGRDRLAAIVVRLRWPSACGHRLEPSCTSSRAWRRRLHRLATLAGAVAGGVSVPQPAAPAAVAARRRGSHGPVPLALPPGGRGPVPLALAAGARGRFSAPRFSARRVPPPTARLPRTSLATRRAYSRGPPHEQMPFHCGRQRPVGLLRGWSKTKMIRAWHVVCAGTARRLS